jgi:hypothetical protein
MRIFVGGVVSAYIAAFGAVFYTAARLGGWTAGQSDGAMSILSAIRFASYRPLVALIGIGDRLRPTRCLAALGCEVAHGAQDPATRTMSCVASDLTFQQRCRITEFEGAAAGGPTARPVVRLAPAAP